MSYRNDHDAALERADALEAELRRTETALRRATSDRDRLASEVERLRSSPLPPPRAPIPAPPPISPPRVPIVVRDHEAWAARAVALAIMLVIAILAVASHERNHSYTPRTTATQPYSR